MKKKASPARVKSGKKNKREKLPPFQMLKREEGNQLKGGVRKEG